MSPSGKWRSMVIVPAGTQPVSLLLHRFVRLSTPAAALALAVGLLASASALADIYTWVDERGTTVIADTPPANPKRVTDLQVVVRDNNARSGRRIGSREATPTEQKLLDRIDALERQQARGPTYSAPPIAAPQPAPAVSYYTSPPPAPSYSSYDPYYYDNYPGYYPSYYYPPAYSYAVPGVVIGRSFANRGFGGQRGFAHRGGGGFARGGRR
jgi:hypothetical protein